MKLIVGLIFQKSKKVNITKNVIIINSHSYFLRITLGIIEYKVMITIKFQLSLYFNAGFGY